MIETVTLILLIILISRVSEEITKIPTTLFLITYSYLSTILFDGFLSISKEQFNGVLYIMIPIILLPDLLSINIKEVQKNILPILYLAIVSVAVSISIAVMVVPYIITDYAIPSAGWIALFTMLMATDAITVSSIFANFNLPSKLKIYAEGESLLNDVTALVIFYFIALPMLNGVDITIGYVNVVVANVVIKSILIGLLCAYFGFFLVKILKDPIEQFIIIYLITIISFLVAEHLHISGILSVIISVLAFKVLIDKELHKNPELLFERYKKSTQSHKKNNLYHILVNIERYIPAMSKKEFRGYKQEAFYIGIFANGIVFILMAYLFNIELLKNYIFEIVAVFLITTSIRFLSVISMFTVQKRPIYWTNTLTLSGVKGALSIIMFNSIPNTFEYKELFEAIVLGNVILSIFLYTLILIYYINKNSDNFKQDILNSTITTDDNNRDIIVDIKNMIEKDSNTNAYNKIFIEDILLKEVSRSMRYKLELSIIAFKIEIEPDNKKDLLLNQIGVIVNEKIRTNDYFGEHLLDSYIIITTNTPLGGATILAQRLKERFTQVGEKYAKNTTFSFGVIEVKDLDSKESIYEKIEDALEKSRYSDKVEIEV